MYADEYYQSTFEVITASGAKETRTTSYREATSCKVIIQQCTLY